MDWRLLCHHHELLLGMMLKALIGAGFDHRWVASTAQIRCISNTSTAQTSPTGIPYLKADPDLDAPRWLQTANPTQGYEQCSFLGTKRYELDVGHTEDAAPTTTARGGNRTNDAAIVVLRSTATTATVGRHLLILDGEQNRLLLRVAAAHVQLKAFVPLRIDPAGGVDASFVTGLAVGNGQIRSCAGGQMDVRQRFGPKDVQPKDALGRKLDLADGRTHADGRQAREGVMAAISFVANLHSMVIRSRK